MVTSGSLFVCESFNELKRECTRDEQVDLDLLTLRVLKDLILFLPKRPSLPLTSEEKKLQHCFKPTWGSFQRKRLNRGSSKPHTHYQLPNLNVKRKRFSQPTGIADPELKASPQPEDFACAAPKIITRLKIIPPKKPHLGISAASSIAVPKHSESPKPTPPRVIDGLNCQGLKFVAQKRRKATKEFQIEEKPPKKPKLNPTLPLSNPSPKLPQNFQNIIDTMGGTQLVLVIQKPLTKTDLNRHNARLSMPLSQINGSFLREAEREYLDQQQAMEVPFMEPSGKLKLRYRAELAKVRAELEPWEKQLIEHKGKLEVTCTESKLLSEKHEAGLAAFEDAQKQECIKEQDALIPIEQAARQKAKESNQIEGIYGRIGDLGAIDAKYDVAITTACPGLDYIVVETTGAAQACVELLRRENLGVATFMILEKQVEFLLKLKEKISTPEGVPRLFDLIRVQDERMKPAFFAALGNTVVAKDLDQPLIPPITQIQLCFVFAPPLFVHEDFLSAVLICFRSWNGGYGEYAAFRFS
nr:structural maintenance of chromosomes protein 4 [Quercus suber]